LVTKDFDGTGFDTLRKEPGILNVAEAYAHGIDELLGSAAVEDFLAEGHNNRTPAMIVADLCPDMSDTDVEDMSQRLTAAKLSVLTGQIGHVLPGGATWPRPTEGFVRFWDNLSADPVRQDGLIATAELSAGHVPFIRAVYNHHGLEQPDQVMTDEVLVREYDLGDIPPSEREKPATLLLDVVVCNWLQSHRVNTVLADPRALKNRIAYAGDCPKKDAGLATNADVEFFLIQANDATAGWEQYARWVDVASLAIRGVRVV
jgi:hypothetical protein